MVDLAQIRTDLFVLTQHQKALIIYIAVADTRVRPFLFIVLLL